MLNDGVPMCGYFSLSRISPYAGEAGNHKVKSVDSLWTDFYNLCSKLAEMSAPVTSLQRIPKSLGVFMFDTVIQKI